MTDLITAEEAQKLLDEATPEPWCSDDVAVRLEDKSLVALVYSNGQGSFTANNRLIAAAPDLARTVIALHAELAQASADAKAAVAVPVAWKYRWKIDGEYVGWRYSDASNAHPSLDGYEEQPLYSAPEDAIAEVAKLRAELDEWKRLAIAGELTARHLTIVQTELAACKELEAVLREALDKARDQGREPDYCYDNEWEYTLRWDEWQDLVDSHDTSEPVEVNTLFKGPTKWVAFVPNSRDEDGNPNDWDAVMVDSEAEARAALAQPSTEVATKPDLCNKNGREGDQT